MKNQSIEELEVYQLSMLLADDIWTIVLSWEYFQRNTIGNQLVRSADSISANIAEGYGRFFYKENRQFLYYARGSLLETKTWLTKSESRKLIEKETSVVLLNKLRTIHIKLNAYIKSIGQSPQ